MGVGGGWNGGEERKRRRGGLGRREEMEDLKRLLKAQKDKCASVL